MTKKKRPADNTRRYYSDFESSVHAHPCDKFRLFLSNGLAPGDPVPVKLAIESALTGPDAIVDHVLVRLDKQVKVVPVSDFISAVRVMMKTLEED